jgi:predicted hydrocarbon binding protein
MIARKHISLEKKYIEKMKPYLAKHNGNFSAAVRDVIELAEERSKFQAGNYSENDGILVDCPTLRWFLKRTDGMFLDEETLNEIIDSLSIKSMSMLEQFMNAKFNGMGWGAHVVINYDDDINPFKATVSLKGGDNHIIDFLARIIALYLANNKCLGIQTVYRRLHSMKINMQRKNDPESAYEDSLQHLGYMQNVAEELSKKPDFWRALIKRHSATNYNMVTLHKNHFEDLLAHNIPIGGATIESISKKPISDIPHREFLILLKDVYETARVVDRIDLEGENIKVFHSFRNPEAIDTLKKIFIRVLEENGHTYDPRSTSNLILLQHRPEIGIKMIELLENLKESNSRFDKEIVTFLTFLHDLKQVPDVKESILSLGRRMSRQILKEYEKEHNVKKWDMKTFQEAFATIDAKILRQSEWHYENNSLIYIVRKCSLVNLKGTFSTEICHLTRGIFKGSLEYAFKGNAELNIIKLLTHGDDRCEVCITASHPHNQ